MSQKRWYFLIETNLLLAQVYFGGIFILMAKVFKVKSFWNKNKVSYIDEGGLKVLDDVWSHQKANSDFLRHLKFEFMQYGFHGSFLFLATITNPHFKALMPFPMTTAAYPSGDSDS